MQPDKRRRADNSPGQSQMPSTKEISRNTPEQCSWIIKGKMACLPSDDDKLIHENGLLAKRLARSQELALVYRGEVSSLNRKITKLQDIVHAMIGIDKKAAVNGGEKASEIKSDNEKLQEFRLLAHKAQTLLKKINNDGDMEVKNDNGDTEFNEEDTEDSDDETESSDEEAEYNNKEDMDTDEDEDFKEALRRSLSEGIGSSSRMASEFYNSNDRQGSNLVGTSESASSSCLTSLQQSSAKLKSSADPAEIIELNTNEAKLMQQKRKRDTDWGSEEDMLCALTGKPEMLLEAACALYRTERQRRASGTEVPYRRPTDSEFERLTEIAIVLMEGKISGPNKKTAEELDKYISGGFSFCASIVGTCSAQMFAIYSRGWDDHFC